MTISASDRIVANFLWTFWFWRLSRFIWNTVSWSLQTLRLKPVGTDFEIPLSLGFMYMAAIYVARILSKDRNKRPNGFAGCSSVSVYLWYKRTWPDVAQWQGVLLSNNILIWAATWQNQQSDCAPSEDSDQPRHPPSLISVFNVRMKKAWVLSYPLSAQRRLWSDWEDAQADLPSLIRVFAGRTAILLVLSCRGSFVAVCLCWSLNQ